MLFQNAELHNVGELIPQEDGSHTWLRVPHYVADGISLSLGKYAIELATGVELRFVLKGKSARLTMSTVEGEGAFHVYRGSIQGNCQDCESDKQIGPEPRVYEIGRIDRMNRVKEMSERLEMPWDCEVVRVVFDRGRIRLHSIEGDIEPPTPAQRPQKTILFYGSSITHGCSSLDLSHSWPFLVAHNLKMDYRNLGMPGSCAMEPEFCDYLASEGERGNWDVAVLELGINVINWADDLITERVTNVITQVAGRNPEKPVFVISPFFWCEETFEDSEDYGLGEKWRKRIAEIVDALAYSNVTYINGLDILDNESYMSADFVHPNIQGVQRIADRLTEKLSSLLSL